jgi:hypothetical protein
MFIDTIFKHIFYYTPEPISIYLQYEYRRQYSNYYLVLKFVNLTQIKPEIVSSVIFLLVYNFLSIQ